MGPAHQALQKEQMSGPGRLAQEMHIGFFGCTVTLPRIAGQAGADQVFPGILSAVTFGDYVVHGHGPVIFAAILAGIAVPLDDVLSVQHNLFIGFVHVDIQAHNTGQGDRHGYRMNIAVISFHQLDLFQVEQNDGLFGRAQCEWFIILVEYQYFSVKHVSTTT